MLESVCYALKDTIPDRLVLGSDTLEEKADDVRQEALRGSIVFWTQVIFRSLLGNCSSR